MQSGGRMKSFEKCLGIMEYAVAETEEEHKKTRIFGAFDPIRDLTFSLQEKLANEQIFFVFNSSSTENLNKSIDDNVDDSRIRYSLLVTELLNKFCRDILVEIKKGEQSEPLLSAKQLALVASVLEFYVATSIAPFLDKDTDNSIKGVGNEIECRSKLVKEWLLIECSEKVKCERLLSSVRILRRMAKTTPELLSTIMPKFLSDFICANEQLINLKVYDARQEYEEFIKDDISRPVLMYELFCILNRSGSSHRRPVPPKWFQLAIGHRLSELIMETNGLYHLITALTQDGVDMFSKYTFVEQLATVLSTRPMFLQNQEKRRPLYYGNILKQLLYVIQFHPMAETVANWFAVTVSKIYKIVPRAVDVCIFDSILHPWELLMTSLLPLEVSELCWSQRLDISLKTIVIYLKGLPPMTGIPCLDRFLKVFSLWLRMYGHLQLINESKAGRIVKGKCTFITDLETVLLKVLKDPGFSTIDKKAALLTEQVGRTCFKTFEGISVQLKEEPKVCEVETKNFDENDDHYMMRYENIELIYDPEDHDGVKWLDDIVAGVTFLLQAMEKNESQQLLSAIFKNCLYKCQKHDDNGIESGEFSRFLSEPLEFTSKDGDESNMRIQYLMANLGELLASLDFHSNDVLIPMLDTAKRSCDELFMKIISRSAALRETGLSGIECQFETILLENTYVNVKKSVDKQTFDVTVKTTDQTEKAVNELQLKTAELAIALISGTLLVARSNEQFSTSLSHSADTVEALCAVIEKLNETARKDFAGILNSGKQLLDVLKSSGIITNTSHDSIKEEGDQRKTTDGGNLLDEVYRDLADSMEPVRGHALILLARLIRKRSSCIGAIENDPEIMRKVIKQLVSSDSYVYMAAINAMAELAYWKQHYFDMVVEFFLKPVSTLQKVAEEDPEFNFTESEKKDFLMVQRVKVGEALAKVCRTLGDMAPWHFERLIDPLLYMVKNTRDRQLKASSLCALGDLVVACRGRGFDNVLNEMLSMIQQFLTGGSEPFLRRAGLTLLRSIIISFDTEILTGLSFQLADVHRHLRQLLLADRDESVRLLAELCLIDIKEQLNKSFSEMSETGIRKIRIT